MQDLSVRVDDLLARARRRFQILAVVAALHCVALGALLAAVLAESVALGVAVGMGLGIVLFLLVLDWGGKLDHKPRGLNLVRARTGASLLTGLVPIAPFITLPLLRLLREPVLVSYAIANHPDAGSAPDEDLLATIRVRSAFVLLRSGALIFGSLGVLFVIGSDETLTFFDIAGFLLLIGGVLQGVVGLTGSLLLRELTPRRVAWVRRISWLLWPIPPLGTYAAWAAREAFAEPSLPA